MRFYVYVFADSCTTNPVNDATVAGWLETPNGTMEYLTYTFVSDGLYNSSTYTFNEYGTYNLTVLVRSPSIGNITSTSTIVILQEVGGGSGIRITSGGVAYDIQCDRTTCAGCSLRCDIFIKNQYSYARNVSMVYWIEGVSHPTMRVYSLEPEKMHMFTEYVPIDSDQFSTLQMLNLRLTNATSSTTGRVIFRFGDPASEVVQEFRIVSWVEKNMGYVVLGAGATLLIILGLIFERSKLIAQVKRMRERLRR